jgi:hypothetical protein
VVLGEAADRRYEGGLGPAEAVYAEHRVAGPGGERRDQPHVGLDRVEAQAPSLGDAAGRGEESHPEVQVLAHAQAPAAERIHPAAQVGRDPVPGPRVRADRGVGLHELVRRPHPHLAAGDDRIPVADVVDSEPDPRRVGADVDHVGVETLG